MQGIREQRPLVVAQEIMKGIHARIWLAGRFRPGWVAWEGGKLVAVKEGKPPRGAGGIVDLGDARVAPGFVDTLLHGFGGHDVGEASAHELHLMTQALASAGVTDLKKYRCDPDVEPEPMSIQLVNPNWTR